MKHIFIPQIPDSITDITTNSSSEIFVIGQDKEIDVIEELIDSNEWRWWFGEKKKFETLEQLRQFAIDYSFVAERLFELQNIPVSREINSFEETSPDKWEILTKTPSPKLTALCKEEEKLQHEYFSYKAPSDFYKSDKELDEKYKDDQENRNRCTHKKKLYEKYVEASSNVRKQHKIELNSYFNNTDLSKWVGSYYYECGEDNELSDWDKVHDTIPGNYARIG